ncbi:glycoside hydrolase family 28 protein [Asticcacaulis sp. AND118]|uniref:rhamnogalacturonidase n=1 Tax=Asticcacaulis sp. AND118 TaxID=2840468 RepID=UPI001CFF9248|nr:glycosyl hydrolase family 28 protein [Asticcacaulis sp. AND118]UDF03973.1 right-handed parallel beta-helix repeat-containing protein [Asticcacaulis sp. AND118]
MTVWDVSAGENTVCTTVIQAAIDAAAVSGGTVRFPAGRYLSFSLNLKSGVTLHLEKGAVLVAADPAKHGGQYDLPEDNPSDLYQDFGHSHWRNSLIWAEDAAHIAITGEGMIDGEGLTREGPGSQWKTQAGEFPLSMRGLPAEVMAELAPEVSAMQGLGNKAIALKNCRQVTLKDFTIRNGGHFALLATGVDDMTIKGLTVDTNRDGLDIDACRRVTIRNCRVNTPNDDAIVLKSSFALGEARACEDISVEGCTVSGYDLGTLLDGTFGRTQERSPDQDRVTGRIKIGTESNGGFKRIRIRDCRFERSRGLALETVDGGWIEDVLCENLTLTEITTAPIFLRVGARLRGPEGTVVGGIRNVTIRNLTATDILPDYCALIMGLPESPIHNVTLENVSLTYRGGMSPEDVAPFVDDLPTAYPEPSMFGITPAWGLWARHVQGLRIEGLTLKTEAADTRDERLFFAVG